MNNYTNHSIPCPHCHHSITMILDHAQSSKTVYDDCPSCHHAIELSMTFNPHTQSVSLSRDNHEDGLF